MNKDKEFVFGMTSGGCRIHTDHAGCRYEKFARFIAQNPSLFERIIYEQAGIYLFNNTDGKQGSRKLISEISLYHSVPDYPLSTDHIDQIKSYLEKLANHTTTIWYGPLLEPHIPLHQFLKKGCQFPFQIRKNQRKLFEKLDDHTQSVMETSPVQYISQIKKLGFDFTKDFASCDALYWRDGDHYSQKGVEYFTKKYNILKDNK